MQHTVANHHARRFFWLLGIQAGLVLLLLISAAVMSISTTRIQATDERIQAYRIKVIDVRVELLAMENSLLGYISTSDPLILEPYRTNIVTISSNLNFLAVDAPFPESVQKIRAAYTQWNTDYAERAIALMQAGDPTQAERISTAGQSVFDATTNNVEQLRLMLRARSQALRKQVGLINWLQLGNVTLLGLLIATSMIVIVRFWKRERVLWRELQTTSHELATSNTELQVSTAKQSQINQQLRSRIEESRLINNINDMFANSLAADMVYANITRQIGEYLGGWCSISLRCPAPDDQLLYIAALYHPDEARLHAMQQWLSKREMRVDQGLHAPLFTNQQAVVILQVPAEVRRPTDLDPALEAIAELVNLTSYIGVPITIQTQVMGVLAVASSTNDKYFDAEQELFLSQAADRIASWFENRQLFHLAEQRANELQTSFDSITDLIATYDKLGQQIRINKTGRQFLGHTTLDALAPELVWRKPNGQVLTPEEHPVQQALHGETVVDVELAIPRWDGELVVHTVSVAPLRSADGHIGGAVLVARDITARKELDRLKEELVANMSHELRTPLTAILGYSELLLKRRAEVLTPWHTGKLEGIRTGGQRLLALVNDLLDIAKLDAGHIELQREPLDINQLAQTQVEILLPMMNEKRQQFSLNLSPALPNIQGDPHRISQVITNLLSNAIKFTPNEGLIRLSSGHVVLNNQAPPQWLTPALPVTLPQDLTGQYVVLSIKDTGVGISAQAMPHLWERFYQAEGGTSRRFGGTGLGLSIVQQLIAMHGGSVWATSPGEDQGSTFAFVLPIEAASPVSSEPQSLATPTILMIENDVATAQTFGSHLRQAGFNVVLAHSADEALAWARTGYPTAITLDLMLPESDGWNILAALRELPHLVDVPVVIASTQNVAASNHGLTVSNYLVKPISGESLIRVVQQLLGALRSQSYVLVVDDDIDMAELMGVTLQEHGYITRTASDGSIALDMIRAGQLPSLILLDLMMPIVDGFQLLARLRDDPLTRNIPVIVITARDLNNEESKKLRAAAQGIQAKHTLNLNSLVADVQRHVALKEAEEHG